VIPLLQRPDANKLTGVMSMFALGSLVYPLKQISKGEEIDENQIIKQAFFNSGFTLGPKIEMFERANTALDLPFMRDLQNNKYAQLRRRGQSGLSILTGPASGAIEDVIDIAGMGLSGEYNQQDMKKFMRAIPFTTNPLFSKGVKEWVEGLDMPINRYRAKQSNE
jgi:hypothetical protein